MLDFLGGYLSVTIPQDEVLAEPAPVMRIEPHGTAPLHTATYLPTDTARHFDRCPRLPPTRGTAYTDCYVADAELAGMLRALRARLPCAAHEDYIEFRCGQLRPRDATVELATAVRNACLGDSHQRRRVRLHELHKGPVAAMHARLGFPGPALGVFAVDHLPEKGQVLGIFTGELRPVDPRIDAMCRFNFNAAKPEKPNRQDTDPSSSEASGDDSAGSAASDDDDMDFAALQAEAPHAVEPGELTFADMWQKNLAVDLVPMYLAPPAVRELYVDTRAWVGELNHVNGARRRHGTRANAVCLDVLVNGVAVVAVVTKRAVDAGEEILLEYGDAYWQWHTDAMRRAVGRAVGVTHLVRGPSLSPDRGGVVRGEARRGSAARAAVVRGGGAAATYAQPGPERSPSPADVVYPQLAPSEDEEECEPGNMRPGTVIVVESDNEDDMVHAPADFAASGNVVNLVSSSSDDSA